MAKDSQLDPKEVRKMKSKGGPTMAVSALDNEGRNNKKQYGSRHKPGNDKLKRQECTPVFFTSIRKVLIYQRQLYL